MRIKIRTQISNKNRYLLIIKKTIYYEYSDGRFIKSIQKD
jgi:hypothetical protein